MKCATNDSVDLLCSICLEPMLEPFRLECNHTFCALCWTLQRHKNARCPICRCESKDHGVLDTELRKKTRQVPRLRQCGAMISTGCFEKHLENCNSCLRHMVFRYRNMTSDMFKNCGPKLKRLKTCEGQLRNMRRKLRVQRQLARAIINT